MPWDRKAYDKERSKQRRGEPNSPEREKYNAYARQWAYKQPSQIMRRLILALNETNHINICKCDACKLCQQKIQ